MKFRIKDYEDIRQDIENKSVRDLMKIIVSPQSSADNRELPKGIRSLYLHPASFEKAKEFRKYYTEDEKNKLVIVSDTEFGAGEMLEGCTEFPSLMCYGITGEPELAYKAGRIAAYECAKAGYKWSYSPCVDICINHESPMASTRCAGEDADTVITYAGEYMRGMQEGGMAATIKHFPGDGATVYDQHITTSENPLSWEEWNESYGKVYRELIEKGAMSIMPGHIALPCYDDVDEKMGMCPPATLSKKLLTDLLKNTLGFEGLIVSDAVTMGGILGFMNAYEANAQFLKAGGDLLCFGRYDDHFLDKMEELVASGYLPLDVLKDRAYRVECFMRQVEELKPIDDVVYDAKATAAEIVRKSMKVVRDRENVIPFGIEGKKKEDIKVLVLDLSNIYNDKELPTEFYEKLKAEGFKNVDYLKDPGSEKLAQICEDRVYDIVLCTVANGFAFGTNVLRIHGKTARNFMDGWTKLGTPVVFIALRHPYLHEQFKALADTVINCYGVAETTYSELIKKIFK